MRRAGLAFAALFITLGATTGAQTAPPTFHAAAATPIHGERSDQSATLTFFNRPIVVLRARVLGRGPEDRVAAAGRVLDDLASRRVTRPVTLHAIEGAVLVSVADRAVFAVTPADVDELTGETVEAAAGDAVGRLQQALDEAAEARAPVVLLRSALWAGGALALGIVVVLAVGRARRNVANRLAGLAERTVVRSGIVDIDSLRAARLVDIERRVVTAVAVSLDAVVAYAVASFVLRRFPYTRPWGESMRAYLFATVERLALGVADALPGLFTASLILLLARFATRLIALWFNAVERGRIKPRWIYPETAAATRRLASVLVCLFAIVVAYPYLPGSHTEAFKGVTVFLGLMVTFGSSGLVNQIMSGFMLTYSRAVRLGDFVRIGDVEGTVMHLGVLSAKLKTLKNEEVTIPNAVVVSQTANNYTRFGDTEGVYTPTSVTIGYDTAWRQIDALLLQAAARTPGLRAQPAPIVLQAALEDFYVKYTLFVCLDQQQSRPITLGALHANILDVFNEYGVQIMSPNYMIDPAAPKIVARKDWFAAPAAPDQALPAAEVQKFQAT